MNATFQSRKEVAFIQSTSTPPSLSLSDLSQRLCERAEGVSALVGRASGIAARLRERLHAESHPIATGQTGQEVQKMCLAAHDATIGFGLSELDRLLTEIDSLVG